MIWHTETGIRQEEQEEQKEAEKREKPGYARARAFWVYEPYAQC